MHYKDVDDLNEDTHRLAQQLSSEFDLVVGIPRSGLLAANLLCLYLDVPMTDVDGLCTETLFDTGERTEHKSSFEEFDSVLVLDDSVLSGSQMTETQQRLADYEFPFDVQYGAIYISPTGHNYVDHWATVVPRPRVFEWNLIHHPVIKNACVDIDGVLCRDPTPEENDDGERYREFISEVEPNLIPNQPIDSLVTCRLEQYRPETEAWLEEHGVEYDRLVMMNLPDKQTRQKLDNHGQFKASVYESTETALFIESDPRQAREICRETGKPVIRYDTKELLQPGRMKRAYRRNRNHLSTFFENPVSASAAGLVVGKRLVYRGYHSVRETVLGPRQTKR